MENMTLQTGLYIKHSNRCGRLLKLLPIHVESHQSLNTYVTRMWNQLPKNLRDTTTNTFKTKFDKYLDTLDDHPHLSYDSFRTVCFRCQNDFTMMIRFTKKIKQECWGSARSLLYYEIRRSSSNQLSSKFYFKNNFNKKKHLKNDKVDRQRTNTPESGVYHSVLG